MPPAGFILKRPRRPDPRVQAAIADQEAKEAAEAQQFKDKGPGVREMMRPICAACDACVELDWVLGGMCDDHEVMFRATILSTVRHTQ